jgi:hypothetical protein
VHDFGSIHDSATGDRKIFNDYNNLEDEPKTTQNRQDWKINKKTKTLTRSQPGEAGTKLMIDE